MNKQLTVDSLNLLKAVKSLEEVKDIFGYDSVMAKSFLLIKDIWSENKENAEILVKMGLVELSPADMNLVKLNLMNIPLSYKITDKGEEVLKLIS